MNIAITRLIAFMSGFNADGRHTELAKYVSGVVNAAPAQVTIDAEKSEVPFDCECGRKHKLWLPVQFIHNAPAQEAREWTEDEVWKIFNDYLAAKLGQTTSYAPEIAGARWMKEALAAKGVIKLRGE